MKLFKILAVFSLASFVTMQVQAVETKTQAVNKKTPTVTKKVQTDTKSPTVNKKTPAADKTTPAVAKKVQSTEKKVQAKPAAAAQKEKADSDLAKFNKQVGIRLAQRGIVNQNNQPAVTLKYVIENRGENAIKSLHWVGAFTLNGQVFFMQDIPVTFEKPLAAKAKTEVNLSIPLASMPQQAQQLFSNLEAPITGLNAAREVGLSNGSKIIVK